MNLSGMRHHLETLYLYIVFLGMLAIALAVLMGVFGIPILIILTSIGGHP